MTATRQTETLRQVMEGLREYFAEQMASAFEKAYEASPDGTNEKVYEDAAMSQYRVWGMLHSKATLALFAPAANRESEGATPGCVIDDQGTMLEGRWAQTYGGSGICFMLTKDAAAAFAARRNGAANG